jgi:hypothetical protein
MSADIEGKIKYEVQTRRLGAGARREASSGVLEGEALSDGRGKQGYSPSSGPHGEEY